MLAHLVLGRQGIPYLSCVCIPYLSCVCVLPGVVLSELDVSELALVAVVDGPIPAQANPDLVMLRLSHQLRRSQTTNKPLGLQSLFFDDKYASTRNEYCLHAKP